MRKAETTHIDMQTESQIHDLVCDFMAELDEAFGKSCFDQAFPFEIDRLITNAIEQHREGILRDKEMADSAD